MTRLVFNKISQFAGTMPERVGRLFFASFGLSSGRLWINERRRLAETIDRIYFRLDKQPPDEIQKIIDNLFIHFSLALYEILRFNLLTEKYLKDNVIFHGLSNLQNALDKGKGVLLAVPHIGNWELLGAAIAFRNFPLHTFYLAQKENDIGTMIDEFRQYSRLVFHDRDRGMIGALKALKQGAILGMIPDQDGGNHGVYMDFLGHWVSMPAGPANWSLKSGAEVIPLYSVRRGRTSKFDAYFFPALPAETSSIYEERVISRISKLASWMEDVILKNPSQYLWFYDRFKPRHIDYHSSLRKSGILMHHGNTFYKNPRNAN
ncbi:MAG: lysophospholipid acyltransferase family protein [Candidatus Riflebacteria bacterium]|nr:lysophospholipid acyltransferase family protein [Candidatus Riflebacteria bacterium]